MAGYKDLNRKKLSRGFLATGVDMRDLCKAEIAKDETVFCRLLVPSYRIG